MSTDHLPQLGGIFIFKLKAWRNWPALFAQHQYLELGNFCLPVSPVAKSAWLNWQASTEQATFACRQAKRSKTLLLAYVQNVLAKHEMFEKSGGGETSKQGQAVETIACQASSAGQFRQASNAG